MTIERLPSLPDPDGVRAAAAVVAREDAVAPLSEAFLLDLERAGEHYLASDEGGAPRAYAQVAADGSVEAFVAVPARREGLGRELLEVVLADHPTARVWAHGDLPAARALAARLGLEPARELLVLSRPLGPDDATDPPLPPGLTARSFVPGQDDDALLAVNAAAFADHPEQGRLDAAGLADRMALPWFDPEGVVLVVDGDDELVAFHWTKLEPGQDPDGEVVGEVYVVGVRPDRQGQGLAGPLTRLGLAHLARRGVTRAELYVEGDNAPALAAYARAGFARWAVHVMYSCPVHR